MATIHLYQKDSYLRETEARVVAVDGRNLVLDSTIIHPTSGGVVHDTGKIIGREEYSVIDAIHDKEKDVVIHVLDREPKLSPLDKVRIKLDWERRYRLMRLHTASHIIASIMYTKYNALVTGGTIEPEYAKDDFGVDKLDKEEAQGVIDTANAILKRGLEVRVYWLPREEAIKIPGIVKLANRLPPGSGDKLRIVEIPGIDIQADGGPHVKNTEEIGMIELIKVENRGKGRKRMYYTVNP
ncbi:MAG: alanyl-tRNA editing protein [Thermocladium sp.]|jgi:misacylated tRNA(Ala) deacylase